MRERFYRTMTRMIQAVLATDEETMARLSGVSGHRLCVELTDWQWKSTIIFQTDSIVWQADDGRTADVVIAGSSRAFFALWRAEGDTSALFEHPVHIQGHAALAEQCQAILRGLDIDYESLMARYVGDGVAYRVGQVGRLVSRQVKIMRQQALEQCVVYLQRECDLLPTRVEMKQLVQQVRGCRDRLARLEAQQQRGAGA